MKKLLLMLVIVGNLFMLAGKTVTKDYIRAGENAVKFSVENTLQPWLIYGGDESYERSGVQDLPPTQMPSTQFSSHEIRRSVLYPTDYESRTGNCRQGTNLTYR
ncbi:MAG: hypothetical protein MI685_07610 [Chlorobiales bacterium]|nr:hypothetical protein [Chlorobiales bacterium]